MKNKRHISFPRKKISETLLEFAEPLRDPSAGEPTEEQLGKILKIASVVWNAVVLDEFNRCSPDSAVAMLCQTVAFDHESSAIIELMITRKKTVFSNDQRLIGEYKLIFKENRWFVRAEARGPLSETQ